VLPLIRIFIVSLSGREVLWLQPRDRFGTSVVLLFGLLVFVIELELVVAIILFEVDQLNL
jgi:hypothetical protein